jgi:hypothetical protein
MERTKSRSFKLSCNRALVLDSVYFARNIPLFPVERSFDLGRLAELRSQLPTRISWTVLFLKAHALVALEQPDLRRAILPLPWLHLYEHHESVATVAIARQFQGEDRLCWGRFMAPERQTLLQLQKQLDGYQNEPVDEIFRRQVRLSKFPTLLRRMGWRLSLYAAGAKRAKRLGTFSLSSVAGQGAINRFHPTFLTTSLSYSPLDERGRMLVTLICDHRVLDGAPAARALAMLEATLNGAIADELAPLASTRRAA